MVLESPLLITGASGFVAAELLRQFPGGYLVSRCAEARPEISNWKWLSRSDVLAGAGIKPMPSTVIHLEVKQHVFRTTRHDVASFRRVNVSGTEEWLNWCTENGVRRFVYFSSIKAVQPAEQGATDESACPTIGSHYGASKWEAEALVRRWASADASRAALILRPAPVYGPTNPSNMSAMVRAIAKGRFFLVGANDNIKSVVSLRNLAAATSFLARCITPGMCEIYNITDEHNYTVREIDRIIRGSLGKPGNSPTLPLKVARVVALLGDSVHLISRRTFPLNSSRLAALTESTHFSSAKLASTGFRYPQSTVEGICEMTASANLR